MQETSANNPSTSDGDPNATARGLATVALLKARFDRGLDQIDTFMPLVIDAINSLRHSFFSIQDIQNAIFERHDLAMPLAALKTLLARAARQKKIVREAGMYRKTAHCGADVDVNAAKKEHQAQQFALADALLVHAQTKGMSLGSRENALELILRFVEEHHVTVLLGSTSARRHPLSSKEDRLVAEFCETILKSETPSAPGVALQVIVEGLVLSQAAFLSDIGQEKRKFENLAVYLDSNVVMQALGFEGPAQELVALEALKLLVGANARCCIFDESVQEIHRILRAHIRKMSSAEGRLALRQTEMTRYLSRRTPADLAEISATLEHDIKNLRISIDKLPQHVAAFTVDEKTLGQCLADEWTGDDAAPRVVHDVNCVAAIFTLRKGIVPSRIDDARFVFATLSQRVVTNITNWYAKELGDDAGFVIGPIVPLRALVNLAWIRCPALVGNLKKHELVALCAAAMKPSVEIWERFKHYLRKLRDEGHLTNDELVAIVASEMADRLLGDIEESIDEPDAESFDEVIDRVKIAYRNEATEKLLAADRAAKEALAQVSKAEAEARAHAESADQRVSQIDHQVSRIVRISANLISRVIFAAMGLVAIVGAFLIVFSHDNHETWWGISSLVGIAAFVLLELLGVLDHAHKIRGRVEIVLYDVAYQAVGRRLGLSSIQPSSTLAPWTQPPPTPPASFTAAKIEHEVSAPRRPTSPKPASVPKPIPRA